MDKIKAILFFFVVFPILCASSQNIQVHDPVMIREGDSFYLFCTGMGISCWSSKDMNNWKQEKPVFSEAPEWAVKAIPGFKNHIWAPDISFHNNQYYLFYSVSAFGKNTSCIGLATNHVLDPSDKDFKWTDHGLIVQSVPNRDMWNAIDPNLIVDENNTGWLDFGSFWGGIKLVKMNKDFTVVDESQTWFTLSKRKRTYELEDDDAGDDAVEAPFIIAKNGFYFLFVSFDYCCRGLNSTYRIMAGRSEKVTGPYLDKNGTRLTAGGGTEILAGNSKWAGVGHNGICTFEGKDYMVFHGYDNTDGGKPKLLIREIKWTAEEWPEINW